MKLASLAPTVEMINWDLIKRLFYHLDFEITPVCDRKRFRWSNRGLQFFVNGQPYGNILSYDSNYSQANYPYSMEWSQKDFNSTSNDHFLIYAKISDTSGNEVMSEPVLYRVTAGGKNIPVLKMESLNNSYAGGKTIFLSVNEISDLNENNDTGIIEELFYS